MDDKNALTTFSTIQLKASPETNLSITMVTHSVFKQK